MLGLYSYQATRNREKFAKLFRNYAFLGTGPLVLASVVQYVSNSAFSVYFVVGAELWGISFLIAIVPMIIRKEAPEKKASKKPKKKKKKRR